MMRRVSLIKRQSASSGWWLLLLQGILLIALAGFVLYQPAVLVHLAAALLMIVGVFCIALAWRVRQGSGPRSFALAVLLLSGCYITLFGPRNEYLSFIVLTPSIAALALMMIFQQRADYRAWLLLATVPVLGFVWSMGVNTTLKPAIVAALFVWLARQMAVPERWRPSLALSSRLHVLRLDLRQVSRMDEHRVCGGVRGGEGVG